LVPTTGDRHPVSVLAGVEEDHQVVAREMLVHATAVVVEEQLVLSSHSSDAASTRRMESFHRPPTSPPVHTNRTYSNNSRQIGNNNYDDNNSHNNNHSHFNQHTSLIVEDVVLDEQPDDMRTTISYQVDSRSIIVTAIPMEDPSTFRALAKNRKVQIASIIAMIMLLVGIILAIVLPMSIAQNSNNNSSREQQPPPSQPPSDSSEWGNTKERFVQDILPQFTRQELQNSSSFQSLRNPYRSISGPFLMIENFYSSMN
jgi:hypothetical protein